MSTHPPAAPPRIFDGKGYRRCAVALVFNNDGKVLVCERLDRPGGWQMPQGGVDEGETDEAAAIRELHEEIGLKPGLNGLQFVAILEGDQGCCFDVEDTNSWIRKAGFAGQCFSFGLFHLPGASDDPTPICDLSGLGGEKPEFGAVRWSSWAEAVESVWAPKRPPYHRCKELAACKLRQLTIQNGVACQAAVALRLFVEGGTTDTFSPPARVIPRMQTKVPVIVVAGPVGAGKGTQCKRIASCSGLIHISVGDLCRAYAQENSELGVAIKGHMDRGEFVPDDLMLNVIEARLALSDIAQHGVIIDGFPRTKKQAEGFLEKTIVDAFILLQVGDEIVKTRAAGRLQDPKSGQIYHQDFMPPPEKLLSKLTYRNGDRDEEAVSKRLEIYHQNLEQIKHLFEGKTHEINGELSPDSVFESISQAIEKATGIHIQTAIAQDKEEDDWSDDEEPVQDVNSPLNITVAPSQDVASEGGDYQVAVSLKMPENMSNEGDDHPAFGTVGRVPSDVCCVIDISGSMRTEATYEDENENVKSDGLNYLDIVKHAANTVIHMLNEHDRLALVAFDHEAETIFPADYMTNEGQSRAAKELQALRPRGRTNIWKGLHAGLEALHSSEKAGWRPKTVLLLTDGVPNETPPEGHIKALRDYKESHPDFTFMINTFGFGYSLDSELLLSLAVEGQGTYGFIPDALLVGTCFVDSVANLLSTQTQSATVHLKAMNGAQFTGPLPGVDEQMVTDTSWGRVVDIGPLQIGGTRELVVPLHIVAGDDPQADRPYLEAVVVYTGANGKEQQASAKGSSRKTTQSAMAALARSNTVSVGYQAVQQAATASMNESAQNMMREHVSHLETLEAGGGDWVKTLKGDVQGRVSKALLGDQRFKRWGKHYLRAFTRAHQVQYCTNFMDKSLQDYGGNLFRALRSEGDSIFVSLPPPQPAPKPSSTVSQTRPSVSATPAAQPDMTVYYGGGGGG